MFEITLFLCFIGAGILAYVLVPVVIAKTREMNEKNAKNLALKVDVHLQGGNLQKAYRLQLLAPAAFGLAGFVLFHDARVLGIFAGIALGVVIPRLYVAKLIRNRKAKFNEQLMDALMIMSSSFRGGLSLIQAVEAVTEEMPEPVKQEFGIVLGENKMGVALDESLNRLYQRMPSPGLQQMITAILLARETGGNLPLIFSRIVTTIRERRKIEQNLQTLTVQGKIQAAVMTGLPVVFVLGVSATNPKFFDPMLHTPDGQKLVGLCLVLWLVGAISILKISTFKDV
jgi:tight adherence protein B